jgi:hypothetical protein
MAAADATYVVAPIVVFFALRFQTNMHLRIGLVMAG